VNAIIAVVLALVVPHAAARHADVTLTLVEYRVVQAIGQVRLTSGYVHDPETQEYMLADLAASDHRGIVLVAGDSVRRFARRETIGAHRVETTLTVSPAVGHGYRGGMATVDVVIIVDGRTLVDCPFDSGPVELQEIDVLARDGMLSIRGSYGDKRVEALVPLGHGPTINAAWLARTAR